MVSRPDELLADERKRSLSHHRLNSPETRSSLLQKLTVSGGGSLWQFQVWPWQGKGDLGKTGRCVRTRRRSDILLGVLHSMAGQKNQANVEGHVAFTSQAMFRRLPPTQEKNNIKNALL